MKNVTVETKLTINLTASQWQLYSSVEGVNHAAYAMNAAVQKALMEHTNPGEAYGAACKAMRQFRNYGAVDSEPLHVLDQLMQLRFPGQWQ